MPSDEIRGYYDFITTAVHEAGQIVIDGFYGTKNVKTKGHVSYDLVTEYDKKVEELLVSKIKHRFANHEIIGEETWPTSIPIRLGDTPTWIIDPIDGTTNFTKSVPIIGISVALSINRTVVLGVVYNPILQLFYSAIKGEGAYCNGKPIHSSSTSDLHNALIGNELSLACIPFLRSRTIDRMKKLSEYGVLGFRSLGCAAMSLCYVADGRLDVYFTDGLQCWDVAAGVLILEEAGGLASNPNGEPFDMFSRVLLTAGNKVLLHKTAEILSKSDDETKEIVEKLMPHELKP